MKAINYGYLLIAIGILSCRKSQEKVHPIRTTVTESIYAAGTISSNNQYKVFPTVSGTLTAIYVKEGDTVKEGQLIFRVDNATAVLNTEQAAIEATYAAARNNRERLSELTTALEQAKANMELSEKNFLRQKQLWAENIGTRNEYEQRQLAYTESAANYRAADLRLAQLIKEIDFQEKQSNKNFQIRASMAKDYEIRSEFSGRMYSIIPKKGELVSPQNAIAIIGDANAFILELQVDEYDITQVKPGQRLLVTMDSYRDSVFEAVITKIDPTMNERSKSFTVEAAFTQLPGRLFPNLTCEANILLAEHRNTITIPRSYLLPGDFVLIGRKEKKKIRTGLKDYRQVEVLEGLTESDVIYKPAL